MSDDNLITTKEERQALIDVTKGQAKHDGFEAGCYEGYHHGYSDGYRDAKNG